MTTTTVREFRANMKKHFDLLEENKEILTVSRQGNKEPMVIMTLSEYNSIVETEYLLSTEGNRNIIEQALSELEKNETTAFKTEK